MIVVGHYCHICGRSRPNEAFSGGGHKNHLCKDCKRLPVEKRQNIEQKDEIFKFLRQSNISRKNLKRLQFLKSSGMPEVADLADIVFEVAKIKPHKRQRLKMLARTRRDLLLKLEETGLILAHYF
jgi:hypothetical protein